MIAGRSRFVKTAANSPKRKTYSVPAVERAFDMLELLVSSGTSRNITEISRQLKIPKSSVFGILVAISGCMRGIQSGRSASAAIPGEKIAQ